MVVVALFVNVSIILPLIGVGLCFSSLVMDLIHSLKSEKRDFDVALKSSKESIMVHVNAVDNKVRLVESELARINRTGVF